VPQIPRPARHVALTPTRITRRVVTHIRPVPVRAVVIQQQMHPPGHYVIPVRGRPFDAALDDGALPAGARPRAKEPVVRDFGKDGFARLVLHEAQKRGRVVDVAVEREVRQVDDVGGVLVDEGLRCGEGAEVLGVGVADTDVGGGSRVPWVGGGILMKRRVSGWLGMLGGEQKERGGLRI
jgi:hypothetical protein